MRSLFFSSEFDDFDSPDEGRLEWNRLTVQRVLSTILSRYEQNNENIEYSGGSPETITCLFDTLQSLHYPVSYPSNPDSLKYEISLEAMIRELSRVMMPDALSICLMFLFRAALAETVKASEESLGDAMKWLYRAFDQDFQDREVDFLPPTPNQAEEDLAFHREAVFQGFSRELGAHAVTPPMGWETDMQVRFWVAEKTMDPSVGQLAHPTPIGKTEEGKELYLAYTKKVKVVPFNETTAERSGTMMIDTVDPPERDPPPDSDTAEAGSLFRLVYRSERLLPGTSPMNTLTDRNGNLVHYYLIGTVTLAGLS